ncbi:hypothetical protein HPP92_021976 [Vanilla planifolia]|uniref:Uncharacterized protein n=1 Tax=Vanilla planifolia TaxID=51239 RepID=A0A835PTW8_VANPL|nr:hypothetical protein HPP92_021976 [Vanilla planifolia]
MEKDGRTFLLPPNILQVTSQCCLSFFKLFSKPKEIATESLFSIWDSSVNLFLTAAANHPKKPPGQAFL